VARRGLLVAGALGAVVVAAVFAATRAQRAEAVPVYWDLPSFVLIDQDGQPRSAADLRGAPWVADFIFTRCAGACPRMTARMSRLEREIPSGARLVSITVDPENDTPAVLKQYAAGFGAGPRWWFLTGSRTDLYRLAVDGFKLEAMEVPLDDQKAGGDGPFLHSSKLALVDGDGRVRGYYDSTDEDAMARLAVDLRAVAKAP
jgi:protein SCO1/2